MITMQELLTQDTINQFNRLLTSRARNREWESQRIAQNQQVHDLIDELSYTGE